MENLIICPNDTKITILEKINKTKKITPIKFMSMEEFIDNYFYTYDNKAISFIMHKYHLNISISKMYLKNLYFIDCNKKYKNKKTNLLQEIKLSLIENNLLYFNNNFLMYLKTKKIKVVNYPRLEKYLLDIFKELDAEIINKDYCDKKFTVYSYKSLYEEVASIIYKIIELVRKGISLNKIFLLNVTEEYIYTIKNLFSLFHIPIELGSFNSISTSLLVKRYLESKELPEVNEENRELVHKIIDIKNSLVYLEDDDNYDLFLLDAFKNTSLSSTKYRECVHLGSLFDRSYARDEYVFVLGFNEQKIPILYKDEDYITDNMKDELPLYSTKDKNKRERDITICYLTHIDNLFISYKDTSYKDKFYPSSMIKDYKMEVVFQKIDDYTVSHAFNKRMLAVFLDNYYKYREKSDALPSLYTTYKNEVLYDTYSNTFTGISKDLFLKAIPKVGLSYTSMNTYNLCGFKYYINYILKLDPYEESFATLIGNLFHYVLERYMDSDFSFDKSWSEFLKDKELLIKEEFFLEKLKKTLSLVIEVLKEQKMYTSLKDSYCEKCITIPLKRDIYTYFTGKIDKILYKSESRGEIYAIVDYKTGNASINLYNMKYGIDMQLATYLYLIEKGEVFQHGIFGGMYLQQVLPKTFKYDGKNTPLEKLKKSLCLMGYSTSDENILCEVDHEYTDSKIIKSMKTTAKGFSSYAKVLSEEEKEKIVNYTEKVIDKTLENIINSAFQINPKRIDGVNESCKYCKYKDLCFYKEEDVINLEKSCDFSFLGGDFNGEPLDRRTTTSD